MQSLDVKRGTSSWRLDMDERWNRFIDNTLLRSVVNATAFVVWFWLSMGLLAIH